LLQGPYCIVGGSSTNFGVETGQSIDTVVARIRQLRAKPLRTRVFGLFAIVWVGLVLQPCALATVQESDCPHCPPEIDVAPAAAKSHCNPDIKRASEHPASVESVRTECCDLDESIVNVRLDTIKVDDNTLAPQPGPPALRVSFRPQQDPRLTAGPPEPSCGTVPLHVLNCVYLD
jgi:hypothetical protein